jgi:hypothetical protein
VRAQPAGDFLDLRHALVAALLDDVGRAVEPGQGLPVGVPRHGDDPLRAELPGREDRHQADGAVTDDRDRLARAHLGCHGGEPAGAQHVGGGQQRGDQLRIRLPRRRDKRAVGVRDAGPLGLGAAGL